MKLDRTLLLLAILLVAVGSSAVAGVVGLRHMDAALRTVVDVDSRRLLVITGVRRFFRMSAMLEQELAHSSDAAQRDSLEARLRELREQRRELLHEHERLMLPDDVADQQQLTALDALATVSGEVAPRWEAALQKLVETNDLRLHRRVDESGRVGRAAEVMLVGVSGLAFVLAAILGAAVTQRMRRDAAEITASESRLRQVIESVPSVLTMVRPDGHASFVSPHCERITGLTDEQLAAEPTSWAHPQDRSLLDDAVQAALAGTEAPTELELRGRRPDGVVWFAAISLSVMRTNAEASHMVLVQILDVSRRREAEVARTKLEEQLRHAQKMESIGRLAGGVAHDFNNLLTAITGYASLAQLELGKGHPVREMVDVIAAAAGRAATLTRQLLAFSRKQRLEPKNLDLNRVLADMHRMLVRIIGEDVQLELHPAPNLGVARVDPGQFEQIIVNLVVNARDAMPNGGRLVLETGNATFADSLSGPRDERPAGEFVMLAVSDNGVGMSPEVRSHLFEPFFSTKAPGHGTGLGLSMVYGAVRQHGGFVQVYSEVGVGTTFRVYFPLVDVVAEKFSSEPPAPNMSRGTEKILLVEDDLLVRKFAHEALVELGYTVFDAESSEAARKIASGLPHFDLLLTDIVLPGVSGLELAAEFEKGRPGLRVLFASGYSERILAISETRTVDFLPKPYNATSLAQRVRAALDRPSMERVSDPLVAQAG